jgi:hypothetical protein
MMSVWWWCGDVVVVVMWKWGGDGVCGKVWWCGGVVVRCSVKRESIRNFWKGLSLMCLRWVMSMVVIVLVQMFETHDTIRGTLVN